MTSTWRCSARERYNGLCSQHEHLVVFECFYPRCAFHANQGLLHGLFIVHLHRLLRAPSWAIDHTAMTWMACKVAAHRLCTTALQTSALKHALKCWMRRQRYWWRVCRYGVNGGVCGGSRGVRLPLVERLPEATSPSSPACHSRWALRNVASR